MNRKLVKETGKSGFENQWENSISGEEFVKQGHKHIDELYAAVC
jgi:hypothetical protein